MNWSSVVVDNGSGIIGSGASQAEVLRPSGHTGESRIPWRRGGNHRPEGKGDDRDGLAAPPAGRHGMIKILIADDHPMVRQGLSRCCRHRGPCRGRRSGEWAGGARPRVEKDYDVILLDISMPGKNGSKCSGVEGPEPENPRPDPEYLPRGAVCRPCPESRGIGLSREGQRGPRS